MRRTRRIPRLLPFLLVFALAGLFPSHLVVAASGDACNPERSPGEHKDFDGWTQYFSSELGGANVQLDTYQPTEDQYGSYIWSMLTDSSGQNFAQVGYESFNGGSVHFFIEWTENGTPNNPLEVYTTDANLPRTPTPGDSYNYTVLYDNTPGKFTFEIDGYTLKAAESADGYTTDEAISPVALDWDPYGVQISGEVDDYDAQMFGDLNDFESLANSGYVFDGSSDWDVMGSAPITNTEDWFYSNIPSGTNNVLDIGDVGCPASVTDNDIIGHGDFLDTDGSQVDTNIDLESSTYHYFFQSNNSNGTFGAWEANDPYDYNGCDCSKTLWITSGWYSNGEYGAEDYMAMQSDDNLVVYGPSSSSPDWTALWSSGQSGQGSGAYAEIGNDGNFVEYSSNGTALWSSGSNYVADGSGLVYGDVLTNGSDLKSPNGDYELVMQSDGNLVLYNETTDPVTALWSSGTSGEGADIALCLEEQNNNDNLALTYLTHLWNALRTAAPDGTMAVSPVDKSLDLGYGRERTTPVSS